jgi:hypothetical protein
MRGEQVAHVESRGRIQRFFNPYNQATLSPSLVRIHPYLDVSARLI